MNAPFWREMPEWTLSFSREKDSFHSGITLQKGAIIVRYGFSYTVPSCPDTYMPGLVALEIQHLVCSLKGKTRFYKWVYFKDVVNGCRNSDQIHITLVFSKATPVLTLSALKVKSIGALTRTTTATWPSISYPAIEMLTLWPFLPSHSD